MWLKNKKANGGFWQERNVWIYKIEFNKILRRTTTVYEFKWLCATLLTLMVHLANECCTETFGGVASFIDN